MAIIYANATDGWIDNSAAGGPTWSSVRDATTGYKASSTSTNSRNGIFVYSTSGRGGFYGIVRSFFAFDVSAISSTVSTATINFYGYYANAADGICVRATAPDLTTNLTAADFDAIDGFVAGASMAGNATDYTAEITSWSTTGYNTITLTADALSDMQSNSILKVCMVEYDYDYLNVDPSFATLVLRNGFYYADRGGTSQDPYIDYTLVPVASEVSKINGTAIGSITAIDDVAKANITSIAGIDLP